MAIYRVRVAWTGVLGSNSLSTHYFDTAVAASPEDCVLATKNFWDSLSSYFTNSLVYTTDPNVDTLDLSGTLTASTGVVPQFGTGTNSNPNLPGQTQARIFWRTATITAGRRLQGSTFVPVLTTASIGTDGTFIAPVISAFNAAADDFAGSNGLVVWSRKHATIAAATGGFLSPDPRVLRSRRD